jgi:hypothetical protein
MEFVVEVALPTGMPGGVKVTPTFAPLICQGTVVTPLGKMLRFDS